MRYIDADALTYEILSEYGADGGTEDVNTIYGMIINAPTIDAELSELRSKDERNGRMTKLIDAELIIEELEKIIQLVKDADGVKVVPLVENALDITNEYLKTGKGADK